MDSIKPLKPWKSVKWNLEALAHLRRLPPTPARDRAYQAQRTMITKVFTYKSQDRNRRQTIENLKVLREWEVFAMFCESSNIGFDPALVEMLNPNSADPSPPDLQCHFDCGLYPEFFELGEIVQDNIAKVSAYYRKKAIVPSSSALALVEVWNPVEKIFRKKLGRIYHPEARPLSLLLYYDKISPSQEIDASSSKVIFHHGVARPETHKI